MGRLLIVSNRLPVTASVQRGRIALTRSTGGLATGLSFIQATGESVWIGWPGTRGKLNDDHKAALQRRLGAKNLVGVSLEPEEVEEFYEGFANEVLWPTFHYLLDRMPLAQRGWNVYERVNDRYADVVARYHRPGDLVWIHDYHLMRVPALLRARIPDVRIGFFLHVPFPPSDVFQTVAWREQLLEGLLGADLIGFHTAAYLRHFATALLRLVGHSVEIDTVHLGNRAVRLGVFPMGVDVARFRQITESEAFGKELTELRSQHACAILLGMDRLDYTKGIPRRLLAFEQLLKDHPELHGRVRLIQVAVPSRGEVGSYRELRNLVDRLVGQIHGAFSTPGWAPVHYIHRGLSERQIAALYKAADVMLVTPVRDGMNLVAKEFVATRDDDDGVLLLSEFAGAADELAGALFVNPYDVKATANVMHRALTMPREERRARMASLRARVAGYDLHRWAQEFLEALDVSATVRESTCHRSEGVSLEGEIDRISDAPYLVVVLDYDGTLVPFAPRPELAAPDPELLDLLRRLAACPATELNIVSGRSRETLEAWFGPLDVNVYAEHGLVLRERGGRGWRVVGVPDLSWRESVHQILQQFAERTPGAFVEDKYACVVWHWRDATDPTFAARQADELRLHLSELLMSSPATVLPGNKIIEVRPAGVSKATIIGSISARLRNGAGWIALGDDKTDEELFAALPPEVVSIHVGPEPTRARFRVEGIAAARAVLERIVSQRPSGADA